MDKKTMKVTDEERELIEAIRNYLGKPQLPIGDAC